MEYTVGMAEAKSKLAELVGQVKYGGNRYILERRGQPMAVLIGAQACSMAALRKLAYGVFITAGSLTSMEVA